MIKNKFLISIVLVLLAGSIFVYMDRIKIRQKSNVITLSWSQLRKDKLTEIISIVSQESNALSYSLKKEKGTWYLEKPVQISLLPEQVIVLINSFLTLTPNTILSNTDDFESYGLNTLSHKILGIFDNQTNGFIIGQEASIGDQFYIQDINNTNLVYLVDSSMISVFMQGLAPMINNYFVTTSTDDISLVAFHNNAGEKFVLTNNGSFWVQTEPEEDTRVDWGTRKFLLELKNFSFDPKTINLDTSDEVLQELGIDRIESPQITLVLQDQTMNTLMIGSSNSQGLYPIYITKENIIAYTSREKVNMVFNTLNLDFQTR
ncbi:MAG: DUF4340 domain-containing protein [Brevinema sp.]